MPATPCGARSSISGSPRQWSRTIAGPDLLTRCRRTRATTITSSNGPITGRHSGSRSIGETTQKIASPTRSYDPCGTRESLRRPRSKAARSGRSVASCRASTLRPVTTSAATAMSHTAAAIPRATKRLCTSRDYGAVGTGGDDVSARPSRGCRSCPARALGQPRTPPRPTRRARAR